MAPVRQMPKRTKSKGLASHISHKPQFMIITVFSDGTAKSGKGLARGLPTKKGLARGLPNKPQPLENTVFVTTIAYWKKSGKPLKISLGLSLL